MSLTPGVTTYVAGVPYASERPFTLDERDNLTGLYKLHRAFFWVSTNVAALAAVYATVEAPAIALAAMSAAVAIYAGTLMRGSGRALENGSVKVYKGKMLYLFEQDHFQERMRRDFGVQPQQEPEVELACSSASHILLSYNGQATIGLNRKGSIAFQVRMKPRSVAWSFSVDKHGARRMKDAEKEELQRIVDCLNRSGLTKVRHLFANTLIRRRLKRDLREGVLDYSESTDTRFLPHSRIIWSRNGQPAPWRLAWPIEPAHYEQHSLSAATSFNPTIDYL